MDFVLIHTLVELPDSSAFFVESVGLLGAGVGVLEGTEEVEEPIRHTFFAEMQEFPQGIPFLQFFCASAEVGRKRKAKMIDARNRFTSKPPVV